MGWSKSYTTACYLQFICSRHTRCGEKCCSSANLDVLQEDASSSIVLERQQLLGMLPLLMAVLLEEVGKARKGHIVTGEVEGLREGTKTVIRWPSPIIIWLKT